jgi:hypothetical protein
VRNARAFLKIQEEFGSFDSYCWGFVEGRPKLNRWKTMRQIPATSPESRARWSAFPSTVACCSRRLIVKDIERSRAPTGLNQPGALLTVPADHVSGAAIICLNVRIV